MAEHDVNGSAYSTWDGIYVPPSDVSSRRDSAASLETFDGSEAVSFYADPPTPTESSYCESFQNFGSASSHLYPGLLPITYIGYDGLSIDYEPTLSPSWLTPTMVQQIMGHAPALKPSPMPDTAKTRCDSRSPGVLHGLDVGPQAPAIKEEDAFEEASSYVPKFEPGFGESMSHWTYPDVTFIPQAAGPESPQSPWLDVAQYCVSQQSPSPTEMTSDESVQEDGQSKDCSTEKYVMVKPLMQSIKSPAGTPCRSRRSNPPKRSSKSSRNTRATTRSSLDRIIDTACGETVRKLQVCNEICTKLPTNLSDAVERREDGNWYCLKAFKRSEHLLRHKINDRHSLVDRSDTRQDADAVAAFAKKEARVYFCPLPGCLKSKTPKDDAEVTGFGNRKDNLEDHIKKTHCTPSEHNKPNERASNKRNERVSKARALELGWGHYYEEGHRKMYVAEIKRRWHAATPAGGTEAIRQVVDYFRQNELCWASDQIRKVVDDDRLYEALRRHGFIGETSDSQHVSKKKKRS